jgi:hypothetical protein
VPPAHAELAAPYSPYSRVDAPASMKTPFRLSTLLRNSVATSLHVGRELRRQRLDLHVICVDPVANR